MKALKQLFGGLIALTLFTATAVSAQNSKFEAGNHYIVISEQSTNKAELREYFSYYCPACRAYEPYLNEFEKVLPKGVKLEKTHVDFMQQTTAEVQFMLSKALIIAEKTAVAKKFSPAIFNYLQTDRATINSEEDIRNIYVLSGGDGAKFDKGMKNFSIISEAKRNKQTQDKLSTARQLTSVPTMVVNGKYLINAKALDEKNFFTDYTALVAHLFTL
ncbi:thiol:disulfide interchange protein DsbA/DsbL [Colwellia hornerae]|uniref:Thiol:disulfide interchange protein n=1 Tax=Colwellia hornerae TaxID=89402 RepID=A0A5C6Q3I0_9GAMM|nr:thiol:disulfide interchange protein DsbA/DsbL [Colwellia hornerae]TWX47421.1 thiol:disulfide interchange protein DsbA/DsbL [Colwellia hornerae]TWX54701.1 thiol:disulfide interchange protein DsbA/DsbL [Colwellia hornerae]TWX63414.1 thiol:disulfide interchange protein DsbA/DsbL [Colwellia hornerae]